MFNYGHYVPILRWKQSEWLALRELREEHKEHITPLIELTPNKFDVSDRTKRLKIVEKTANDIDKNWGKRLIFCDLNLLPSATTTNHIINELSHIAYGLELSLIPITGLRREESYQKVIASIIKRENRGVGIRLNIEDIQDPMISNRLQRLLVSLDVKRNKVDLIVDYKLLNNSCPELSELCALLPNINSWRTFTVISGNFPKDLTGFTPGQHLHPRLDWQYWVNGISSISSSTRKPSFGDYTIQHAIFSEPPGRANYSASIRYAADKDWIVMRGEGVFNDDGPGFSQYPANAQLLSDRNEFYGAGFSAGDNYIYDIGQQDTRTGNAGTWLRAGINHHLTLVVHQISKLNEI